MSMYHLPAEVFVAIDTGDTLRERDHIAAALDPGQPSLDLKETREVRGHIPRDLVDGQQLPVAIP
ncbi:MAG: hypothetical protein WCF36_09020 [Candidatus Nanopelagicales bacterium]